MYPPQLPVIGRKEMEKEMSRYYDDTIADMNQKLSDAMDANNALRKQGLALQARIDAMLATRAHDPELIAAKAELEAVKRANEWHPASELPDNDRLVMVRFSDGATMTEKRDMTELNGWGWVDCHCQITHWRELQEMEKKPEAT
jgi:hypothetical protein